MKISAKATLVVAFVAGLSLTSGTATADDPDCSTPQYTSVPAYLTDPGRWSYTYQATWCVKNGQIIGVKGHLTHDEDGRTCVWVTNAEEANTPVGDGSGDWKAFNMGQLSCKGPDGKPGTVNPWSDIIIRTDGSSEVWRKGVGDVIHG